MKRKGTDVPKWINIMTERSVPHLQKGTVQKTDFFPYKRKLEQSGNYFVPKVIEMSVKTNKTRKSYSYTCCYNFFKVSVDVLISQFECM